MAATIALSSPPAAGAIPLDSIDPSELTTAGAPPVPGAIPMDSIDQAELQPAPTDGAIPLDQVNPSELLGEDEFLSKLTRRELSDRAARDQMAGVADVEKYRRANRAVGKKNQIWDKNELPEDQKAPVHPDTAAARAVVAASNPALGALSQVLPDSVFEIGQHMAEGLFAQIQEAGRTVLRDKNRPLTPDEHALIKRGYPEWYVRIRPTNQPEFNESASNVYQGVKLNGVQAVDMLRVGVNRVANKLRGDDIDDATLDAQFEADVAMRMAEEGIRTGKGYGADLPVDPATVDAISQSPLSDPTMLFPGAAGFKAARAGENITARLLTTSEKTFAQSAASAAGKALAKPFDAAARTTAAIGVTLDNNPLLKGVAAAGVAMATGASPDTELLAGLLGANLKLKLFDKTSASFASMGSKLAGKVPPGPIGRFALSAAATVGDEFKGVVAGQLANTPFLLGAGDEDQLENTLIGGVIAHSAGRGAGTIVNGLDIGRNLWAERQTMPEIRSQIKDYGFDDLLDADHRKVVQGLGNSSNNFVQAVRDFFGKERGEVYTLFKEDYNKQIDALAAAGKIPKDLAVQAKEQQGVTFALPDADGKKRNIAFVRVTPGLPGLSVGHESGHLLETVMSPEERKHVYDATRRFYGEEQIKAYKERYEALANFSLSPDEPSVRLTDEQVLSEIFAEHASAVMNSIPIEKFSPGGPGGKDYSRQVYSLVDRALEKIGAKQPKLSAGEGKTTGTGIEPSARLGNLIENVIQAKKLDGIIPKSALPKGPVAADAPFAKNEGDVAAPRPVEKKEVPGLKKGDPVDEVHNSDGVLVAENAKITKDLGEAEGVRYFEIEYDHPDTGERMVGNVPQTWLESKVTPTAQKPKEETRVWETPITDKTPFGYPPQVKPGTENAADTVAPKQVENVARPEPEKPNVRVTRDQQNTFARPATPEVQDENKKILEEALSKPRNEIPAVETDYYSAKSNVGHPDANVRAEQRRLADKAEAESKRTGKPNPLRAIYQKVFVPYKSTPWGGVFGFSLDKFIQNADILRAWQAEKGLDAAYLTSDQFRADVKTYLENQANGYGGDGRKLERPSDTKPGSITAENPEFTPRPLNTNTAQLINALMGFELPEKMTPAQEYFKRFAEINGLKPKTLANGVPEVNPVRDQLRQSGFDLRLLNSAVENLPLKNLTTPLKARPDIDFKAGDTGIAQAGFMPQVGGPQTARRGRGNEETRSVIRDYIAKNQIQDDHHESYAPISDERMKKIADLYDSAKHEPDSPAVQQAYRALANETMAQYREMVAAGIKIEPYEGKGEPYKNSTEMMADVRDNKHLWFFKTDNAFGDGADSKGNALLEPSGVEINGQPLLVNDIFRAVHDYFGHTAEGFEFGPRGEFNAYLAHSRMFSDDAKPALAAETLAQNAWVNFGPHLRREDGSLPKPGDKDFVPLKERRFADQKNTLVPLEVLQDADGAGRKPVPETAAAKRQAQKDSFRFMPVDGEKISRDKAVDQVLRSGNSWLDPQGNLFPLGPRGDHAAFARTILKDEAGATGGDVTDQLIARGWVRLISTFPSGGDSLLAQGRPNRAQSGLIEDVAFTDGKPEVMVDRGNGRWSPLHNSRASFMPRIAGQEDVQLKSRFQLPHAIGEDLKLVHFGGSGIREVDPKNFGKSGLTSASEQAGSPRSYFYVKGRENKSDPATDRPNVYETTVSGSRIYDGDTDALGYSGMINRWKADDMLMDAGYAGIMRTAGSAKRGYTQVELFEPVKVERGNRSEFKFMPAKAGQNDNQTIFKDELKNGAGDFWLSPAGDLVGLFGRTHEEAAAAINGKPESAFTARGGRAGNVDTLKDEGWVRIKRDRWEEPSRYFADAPKISATQKATLERLGIDNEIAFDHLPSPGRTRSIYSPPGASFMPAKAGQKEYLGAVNGDDVRMVPIPKGSDKFHDEFGLRGDRFRYDPETETVIWTDLKNEVTPEARAAAEDRLVTRGFKVNRQEDWQGRSYAAAFMPATPEVKFKDLKGSKYWLSPEGKFYEVPSHLSHEDWAAKSFDITNGDSLKGDASNAAYKNGWVRVTGAFASGRLMATAGGQPLKPKHAGLLKDAAMLMGKERFEFDDGESFVTVWKSDSAAFMPAQDDVRDTRSYKQITRYLTPDEKKTIRRDVAQDVLDMYRTLPKDEDFVTAVEMGKLKQGWYDRASKTLRKIFGNDTEQFVSLLAATSPRQTVQENLVMALKVWADWNESGRPQDPDQIRDILRPIVEMEARMNNSVRALRSEPLEDLKVKTSDRLEENAQLSGLKVESFRKNLLNDLSAVTNDAWMAMFANVDQSKFFGTKSGYLAFNSKIRKVAEQTGLKPAEVQETIWSFFKTLLESTKEGRTAKETLSSLTDHDILQTPEFYEQIIADPKVREALSRVGFRDEAAFQSLVDPEFTGRRERATGLPLAAAVVQGKAGRDRVLGRIAGKAQLVKDRELAGARASKSDEDGGDPF